MVWVLRWAMWLVEVEPVELAVAAKVAAWGSSPGKIVEVLW